MSQDWTLTQEGDRSQFVEKTTDEMRTDGQAQELAPVDANRAVSMM